jgi:Zn finger protein HypA/HybF involved in hydrogenase expression
MTSGPSGSPEPSAMTSVVLRCEECECVSEDALGWIALVVNDEEEPDQDAYVVAYCPKCTAREFPQISRLR